jgi:hypothetical protein
MTSIWQSEKGNCAKSHHTQRRKGDTNDLVLSLGCPMLIHLLKVELIAEIV